VGPVADPSFGGVATSRHDETLPLRLWRFARAAGESREGTPVVDAHFALYAFFPVVLGRLRRLPLVVHFQGPWADESLSSGASRWTAGIKRRVEKVVYRRAREVVVLSGAFKRILVERYGVAPWRVHVIPPGVDLDHFRQGSMTAARAELGLPDPAWVVLSVRRLVARMGLDVLLRAWPLVSAGRNEVVLVIAGDGPDRASLQAMADDLGISGSVRFVGQVSEEELLRCYQAADVCVVPSVTLEGFGLVVLEALACGTPVVGTDAGGLPEALSGLAPTLVVPAGDASSLARRLGAALDGTIPLPTRRRCRDHAEQFSWDAAASRTIGVYERAVHPAAESKPRVVYLDHCAELSGAELALTRLLPRLVPEVDVHVVLAEDGPLLSRLTAAGVSHEVLPLAESTRALHRDRVTGGRFPLRAALHTVVHVGRLALRLRRLRPDIVHTNSLKAALYGGVAGRIARVPVVWHIRDRIAEDYLPPAAVRLVRLAARHLPQAIVANSYSTLETLPDFLPTERAVVSDVAWHRGQATVIPSAVQVERYPLMQASHLHGNEFRIGMVGRLAPWKGQHVFIESFARAFPKGQFRAVIVGSALFGETAYEMDLKRLVSDLGVQERVEFCGFVEDVPGQLATFDVLVHASVIPEPFGQVIVEGMAAGIAVVAANAGGPAEVIDDGVTGLLFRPGDVAALSAALRRLVEDPGLVRRLGEAGRAKAGDYTPEAIAAQVMNLYRSVLAGSGR
jgi:glycosyltransferase involved in cell wall biosynthesis